MSPAHPETGWRNRDKSRRTSPRNPAVPSFLCSVLYIPGGIHGRWDAPAGSACTEQLTKDPPLRKIVVRQFAGLFRDLIDCHIGTPAGDDHFLYPVELPVVHDRQPSRFAFGCKKLHSIDCVIPIYSKIVFFIPPWGKQPAKMISLHPESPFPADPFQPQPEPDPLHKYPSIRQQQEYCYSQQNIKISVHPSLSQSIELISEFIVYSISQMTV